jgi:hypothetical protein
MKIVFSLIIYFLLVPLAFSQECLHTNLITTHHIVVYTKWYGSKEHTLSDSLDVTIELININTKVKQQLHFGSSWMANDFYTNCSRVKSYVTGFNKDSVAVDNDYGDIVVADFNFDNKADIAFKQNAGGNGGPGYMFYLQDEHGTFVLDAYLTGTMGYFPVKIDSKKRKLITLVHANVYEMGENTYSYNAKKKTWKMTRHRYVKYKD